jgi:hypothetical protein
MKCTARSVLAHLVLASVAWSASAWALDPGNYTIRCTPPYGVQSKEETFDISMDMVDLLTMKDTYGAVISGVRLDDGTRFIFTGDIRNCSMIGLARNRQSKK